MSRTPQNPTATLHDIMTADPVGLGADARLSDALSLMVERRIGSVLVRDGSATAGILTMHDMVCAAARCVPLDSPAAELMSRPVLTLPGTASLVEAYGRMRLAGIRHLLVTGPDGSPEGIASETDFFLHLSREQLLHLCTAGEAMDEDVPRLPPEATWAKFLSALAAAPSGCVAVTDGPRPLAILSESDVLARLRATPALPIRRIADLLPGRGPVPCIAADTALPEAREALETACARYLAVVDTDRELLGVLSLRGLITAGLPAAARTGALPEERRLGLKLRQFQRAVQQSPISVIITDPHGYIEYVNPRFCEIAGYREQELLGQSPRVLKSGLHPPSFYRSLWRTICSGQVWQGEICNRRKDGSVYWESATISPIRDDQGQIVNFVGVKEDITEQTRIAEALRESESNYRNLVESLSGEYVLYRQDPDGRWTYLSPSVERLLGYLPQDLLSRQGLPVSDHPINAHRDVAARLLRAGRRPDPYEIEVLDKAGERRRLRLSEGPVLNAAGQVEAVQGIAQDVTELYLARVLLDGRNRVLERLARGRPLNEVLDALTQNIREADPEVLPGVHILDPDGVHLRLGSGSDLPAHYNRAVDGMAVGDGIGSCGAAIARNCLVVCEDILTDPAWAAFRDLILTTDLRACWSHPIRGHDGRVLGTFAMYYREPRRPRERELKLIESASDLAAVVLEHVHAQAALQCAEERERLLLESTTEGILGLDREGVATFVNPAAARMLGFGVEDLCGTRICELVGRPSPAASGVGENEASCQGSAQGSDRHQVGSPEWDVPGGILMATARDGHTRHLMGQLLSRRDGSSFPTELWSNPIIHQGDLVGSVVTFRDISERLGHERRIRFLAFHDALTGLPNRNLLRESLERELARLRRQSIPFALFVIDLDHFKDVNDSLGHAAGDELLQVAALRLREELRAEDSVARMGGDEFAAIQSHAKDRKGVLGLARRLVDALSRPVPIRGREVRVGASVGVVLVDEPADADTLMAQADMALYQAKDDGRSRFALFRHDMAAELKRELAIVGSLADAIADGDLHLVYQPVVRIPGGALHGVEALVRWRHRSLGALMPADFVPVLERRGLAARLDGWVLARAACQSRDWAARGLDFGRLAVNLSTLHPDDGQGASGAAELVRRHGADPARLELDLTERLLTRAPREAGESIAALQAAGMEIAIDDFGTGYASLSCVRRFNPRTLKIDRALIADMLADRGDAEIVKAAIALGRALGLALVAEGVEEPAQTAFLIAHGCYLAQGYAFGAPMEAQALEAEFLRMPRGSVRKD